MIGSWENLDIIDIESNKNFNKSSPINDIKNTDLLFIDEVENLSKESEILSIDNEKQNDDTTDDTTDGEKIECDFVESICKQNNIESDKLNNNNEDEKCKIMDSDKFDLNILQNDNIKKIWEGIFEEICSKNIINKNENLNNINLINKRDDELVSDDDNNQTELCDDKYTFKIDIPKDEDEEEEEEEEETQKPVQNSFKTKCLGLLSKSYSYTKNRIITYKNKVSENISNITNKTQEFGSKYGYNFALGCIYGAILGCYMYLVYENYKNLCLRVNNIEKYMYNNKLQTQYFVFLW